MTGIGPLQIWTLGLYPITTHWQQGALTPSSNIVKIMGNMRLGLVIICAGVCASQAPEPPSAQYADDMHADTTRAHVNVSRYQDIPENFIGFGWEMNAFLEYARLLPDPMFRQLCRNLAPARLRVGGITADWVTYQVPPRNSSEQLPDAAPLGGYWPPQEKPLPWSNFTALVSFVSEVGWELVFDLNELHGRNCHFNGTTHCVGEWDTSNLRTFLTAIRDHNVGPIQAFELGNELTRSDHINMSTNIADHLVLLDLVKSIWPTNTPPVVGPSTDICDESFEQFLESMYGRLEAVTYHSYPGGDGSGNATDLVDPQWLRNSIILEDKHANSTECIRMFKNMQQSRPDTKPRTKLWLTETNYSYNGVPVLRLFANGFFYLASLGQYAMSGVTLHSRWSLVSYGSFALIHPDMVVATDYWNVVLYHKTVGTRAFAAQNLAGDGLVYAYCSKNSSRVTLMALNPSNTSIEVAITGLPPFQVHYDYLLTAPSLDSTEVSLNGNNVSLGKNGQLPSLASLRQTGPIRIPKHSYGFFELEMALPQCQGTE